MIVRRVFSVVVAGGLVLGLGMIGLAQVDSSRIDEVIKKSVLTPQDFEIIDAYVVDAVGRLVRTVDFTEVARTRASIVGRQSAQAQYAQRFSEACFREIAKGFDYATHEISDPQRRFRVFANLLILVNELNDPRLIDLGIRMISHEASMVRYWAVRVATSASLWEKLSQDQVAAAAMSRKILDACNQAAPTSSPEVQNLMVQFAGRFDTPVTCELLGRIADVRIKSYAEWNVKYELVDTSVLRLLSAKIVAGGASNEQLARQFAQLYSYAIQRYIRGTQNNAVRGLSRNYLVAVLIETEEQSLSKLLGGTQTGVRRALEAGDMTALQSEHDRLLGGAAGRGALPSKFNFNYGNNRTAPLALPEPQPGKTIVESVLPVESAEPVEPAQP
ncbi:MAG TPA: hypothetical protein VLI39_13275 [Sedimentisphaerales bacterium]|nr:hypothetical protein [Sedimentisphaerales bacterium]